MKTKTIGGKNLILAGLLAFTLLIPNAALAETDFNKIVVFGTSISDSGNLYAETGDQNLPPSYDLDFFLVPESAYAIGGHHLSNGASWIEQLARPLGMAVNVLPASRDANPNAMNYATAGTRAQSVSLGSSGKKKLSDQVTAFLEDVNYAPPSDALYVIEMGSNDIRDALFEPNPGEIINATINQIFTQVLTLRALGAEKFLLVNVPPIGFTPAVRGLDPSGATSAFVNSQVEAFNNIFLALKSTLIFTGAEVTLFDFFGLTSTVVAGVEDDTTEMDDFGLSNVADACVNPDVAPFICQVPHEYLFWDGIHPTKAGHAIIAGGAADALGIN